MSVPKYEISIERPQKTHVCPWWLCFTFGNILLTEDKITGQQDLSRIRKPLVVSSESDRWLRVYLSIPSSSRAESVGLPVDKSQPIAR